MQIRNFLLEWKFFSIFFLLSIETLSKFKFVEDLMKKMIIVATYNEKDNIANILAEIYKNVPGVHILVIDDNQAIQVFYDSFPNVDSSPYWVKEIDAVAKKRGVELHGSDYRLVSDKGSRLVRYEMILPVRGSYPQIRAFIADMLVTIPAVALVDMIIKREDIKSGRLEVRLSLNLYLNQ